jgi:hypothetical protein
MSHPSLETARLFTPFQGGGQRAQTWLIAGG